MNTEELTQQVRQRLARISPAEQQARSVAACRLLFDQPEYQRADVVMLFLSTAQEIDTTPLALQAWHDGKRVLAPRISWKEQRMLPVEIHSLTTEAIPAGLTVREPEAGWPVPVADIDLVIVPGLGFDERGYRLGHGRGFYERFLSHRDFDGIAAALAFEDQIVAKIPAGSADVRVELLVTDVKVRRYEVRAQT